MIDMVTLEYNCTEHSITKETPYFMVFGREPRTPMEMFLKTNLAERQVQDNEWKKEIIINLFQALQGASKRISEQQRISQERIIDRISKRVYNVGDKVMIRVHRTTTDKEMSRKKLQMRWHHQLSPKPL